LVEKESIGVGGGVGPPVHVVVHQTTSAVPVPGMETVNISETNFLGFLENILLSSMRVPLLMYLFFNY
jgi:hypothetical protein